LLRLTGRILEGESTRWAFPHSDEEYFLDDDSRLLADCGRKGRSIIMHQAMEMIDQAREKVFLTCQYFPAGLPSQKLLAAHRRGVKVELVYNDPDRHAWPNNWLHKSVAGFEQLRLPKSFFVQTVKPGHNFMHAKLLATEQGALIGSHNYVEAGVKLGTAEIALLTSDTKLADEAVALMRRAAGR
jgi:phosphatidylserine/phosphatidylglycerophosphate/cardiolipin synthase-like enzyme